MKQKVQYFIFLNVYVCVCVSVYTTGMPEPMEAREGIGILELAF